MFDCAAHERCTVSKSSDVAHEQSSNVYALDGAKISSVAAAPKTDWTEAYCCDEHGAIYIGGDLHRAPRAPVFNPLGVWRSVDDGHTFQRLDLPASTAALDHQSGWGRHAVHLLRLETVAEPTMARKILSGTCSIVRRSGRGAPRSVAALFRNAWARRTTICRRRRGANALHQ
jgi:hypothetical protein